VLGACGTLLAPAAATVNGEKITIDEIDASVEEYESSDEFKGASQQGDPSTLKRAFEQEDLSRRIFRAVLEPEAEERGIEITDEIVEEELQTIRDDFASTAAFEEALKEQGLSVDRLESLVYDQQLEELLKNEITADLTPSDAELRAFYEDNAQRYIETNVSHIVVESRREAAQVVDALEKAPAEQLEENFAALARERSVYNPTAVGGGDLGYLVAGEADPNFEETASRLAPGAVSDPVQTELGWEVILVKDRRPIPFEDVRAEIVQTIAGEERDKEWETWLAEAYEAADIEVNPRYGSLDEETRTIVDPETSELPGSTDVSPTETPLEQPAG
jgi:parvulin-like peptidyl-prolyl isomerase